MLRATLLAIAVVVSVPAAAQMVDTPRPAYPAVHSIAASSGAREPRRQTRREPVNRSSGTFAAGALGQVGCRQDGSVLGQHLLGAIQAPCGSLGVNRLGGYEDRGAFCAKIDH